MDEATPVPARKVIKVWNWGPSLEQVAALKTGKLRITTTFSCTFLGIEENRPAVGGYQVHHGPQDKATWILPSNNVANTRALCG